MKLNTPTEWLRVLVPLGLILVVLAGQAYRAFAAGDAFSTNRQLFWVASTSELAAETGVHRGMVALVGSTAANPYFSVPRGSKPADGVHCFNNTASSPPSALVEWCDAHGMANAVSAAQLPLVTSSARGAVSPVGSAGTFARSTGTAQDWSQVPYGGLSGVPTAFTPATHASQHVTGGNDVVATVSSATSGLVPNVSTGGGVGLFGTTNGSTASWLTNIGGAYFMAHGLTPEKLTLGTQYYVVTSDGSTNDWRLLTNNNLASDAAVAVSKLANGAAGTVLIGGTPNSFSATPNVTAISFDATPATGGQVRLPNLGEIKARNADNNFNVPLLSLDASDVVTLSDSSHGTRVGGAMMPAYPTSGDIGKLFYCDAVGSYELDTAANLGLVTSSDLNNLASGIQFASTYSTPKVTQAAVTTSSANGIRMEISAQDATGTTSWGGGIDIMSGTGTSGPGQICMTLGSSLDGFCINDTSLISGAPTQINATVPIFFEQTPDVGRGGETFFLGYDNSHRTDVSGAIGRNVRIEAESNNNAGAVKGGDLTLSAGSGSTAAKAGAVYLSSGNSAGLLTLSPNGESFGAVPSDLIERTAWYTVTTTDTSAHTYDVFCTTNGEWEVDVDLFATGGSKGVIRKVYIADRTSGTITLGTTTSLVDQMASTPNPLSLTKPDNNTLRFSIQADNVTSTKWTLKIHYMTR